jgi:hypothetical protein
MSTRGEKALPSLASPLVGHIEPNRLGSKNESKSNSLFLGTKLIHLSSIVFMGDCEKAIWLFHILIMCFYGVGSLR